MRFDLTISLGNVLTVVSVVGAVVIGVFRVNRLLNWFLVEHEMLIKDYADRTNIKVADLPTRIRATLGI